ncbi:MAG: hypothetical protein ACYS8I_02535, partial [Planctomycetota bacterium]
MREAGGAEPDSSADAPAPENGRLEAAESLALYAADAGANTVILGASDPNIEDPKIGFKFQLQLSSWGAAIKKATFSDGNDNGFDDRDYKDPKPLAILSPVDGILSLANKQIVFVEQQLLLRLNNLHWQSYDVVTSAD